MAKKITRESVIAAAKERRVGRAAKDAVRIDSTLDKVEKEINLSMEQRIKAATGFLHDKITTNLNVDVERITGPRGGTVVIRSKPGEFPRADTKLLRNSLIQDTAEVSPGIWEGYVGTPLDYGLKLETSPKLNRSFLVRTLKETLPQLGKILGGPLEI